MIDFKKIEEEVLKFWKENKIYEKSVQRNKKGKKFYMMDGPPYATGHIHMGTALNKISKDIAMRSQRLQGKNVFDRAGYDTHGVPIEFQIEKEIGSKSKQDIEKFGVKKFIEKCKEFATKYIDVMNSEFSNLGVWMNFANPYLTLSNDYIEKIWETFKVADKKKLLYLGKYPVHICPRCATAVAFNEIEYSKQEDTSVFVKFPLKDKKNTFLLIWTTTAWTLPANTGVMVHPDFIYQEIELSSGERWIIAKELVNKIMAEIGFEYNVKKEMKGKELEGLKYENPLSKHLKLKTKNAYKVVLSARYVNLKDGTGLVHSAPGHGKEDYEVGKEYGLDMPSPVDINGNLTEETGKYAGKKARVVDLEIIEDLEKEKYLVYKHKYVHDYPLCWRCKSPLLMVAQPQWFLKISEIQKKIVRENETTNWIPDWM
jgi:isoleucyl-tRNA synthetase